MNISVFILFVGLCFDGRNRPCLSLVIFNTFYENTLKYGCKNDFINDFLEILLKKKNNISYFKYR